MNKNKNKLRQEFLKKRGEFLPLKKPADLKIFLKFINLPIVKKSKTICFYVSKVGEVDTRELIKYYLGRSVSFRVAPLRVQPSKAKRIVVSKVVGKNLELYEIKSFSDLSPGRFGILEPKLTSESLPNTSEVAKQRLRLLRGEDCKQIDKDKVDLFVIPGLVFSTSGQRLGFGKGYYDRLLKNASGFKLGLAYSWQVMDKLPEEKGDVLMNMVLTEESTHFIPRCAG